MRKTGILAKTLQPNQAEQAVCTVGRELSSTRPPRCQNCTCMRSGNGPFVYVGGEAVWLLNSGLSSKGPRALTAPAVPSADPLLAQPSNSRLRSVYHGP